MRYSWRKLSDNEYDLFEDEAMIGSLLYVNDEWTFDCVKTELGEWALMTVMEKIDTIRLDELFEDIEPTENTEST